MQVTDSLVNGVLGGKKYSKKVQKTFKYVQFTPSICIYKCMGFKIETHVQTRIEGWHADRNSATEPVLMCDGR